MIGLRIGFEMSRQHLTPVLQMLFAAFDKVYGSQPPISPEFAAAGVATAENGAIAAFKNTCPRGE